MDINPYTNKDKDSDQKNYEMGFGTENLFGNLLTAFILLALFIILYCKMTNKTLRDMIVEIKEGLSQTEYE